VVLAVVAPTYTLAQDTQRPPLKAEEIDQLVAPVALYPDTLLAQVLMAATYPLEVVQAQQWLQQNPNLQGDQLSAALEKQSWDTSVKAMTQVPTVLKQMSDKVDWTQKLGDAFLEQQADVMGSVQRLRKRAQEAGQLTTTEQQMVVTTNQTIVIQQANPQVVYVPYYNPTVVYGPWLYPAYPPYYWPPPPGYAVARGIAFGIGVGITAAIWDNAFDWGRNDINININRNNFNNVNINNTNINAQKWEHNVEHRRGVNYPNQATRERYGKGSASAARARSSYRGSDQAVRGAAQQAQRPAAGTSAIERRGQTNGFDGVGDAPRTRAQSSRGQSSRQSMSQNVSRAGGPGRAGGVGGARRR
jgi:hypothetical protein